MKLKKQTKPEKPKENQRKPANDKKPSKNWKTSDQRKPADTTKKKATCGAPLFITRSTCLVHRGYHAVETKDMSKQPKKEPT
jgi:hypothetical protein